ncbi:MAG: CDGSH iron-sulfur domain-containing protein [Magnetococcales bacterium]|nr:CDGSH iron-sulfur domain-containing protein [Magnetococcales bacterium]
MKMYEKNDPYKVFVKTGESVRVCTCGLSKDPPFCDDAHEGKSEKIPLVNTAEADTNLFVCGCGNSKDMPWCDGAHKSCPENEYFKERY